MTYEKALEIARKLDAEQTAEPRQSSGDGGGRSAMNTELVYSITLDGKEYHWDRLMRKFNEVVVRHDTPQRGQRNPLR